MNEQDHDSQRAAWRESIEQLNLSFNQLGDAGATTLALTPWPALRRLDLGVNQLTAEGVATLASTWSQSPGIRELFLNVNLLRDRGVELLFGEFK